MKGYRFYADYGSSKAKRKGGDAPNVLALILDEDSGRPYVHSDFRDSTMECVAAVLSRPNSSVASCGVSPKILARHCKRITEREARRLHPALFAWLDDAEEKAA